MLNTPRVLRIVYEVKTHWCKVELQSGDILTKTDIYSFRDWGEYIDDLSEIDGLVIDERTQIVVV